jgi:hypothetical protein
MASQFDDSDFIDRDFQSGQSTYSSTPGRDSGRSSFHPPTREELDLRVGDAQQKLAELRRVQEELERERAMLEEARRRRLEFQTGREEMLQNLTRGVTLMEEAEFAVRRDTEQMAKTLGGLREALSGVQGIREETWNQENWNTELTKALATIENARMEWNQARLKWALLNGGEAATVAKNGAPESLLGTWHETPFLERCKLGLALTWPVALVGLAALIILIALRR